MNISTYTRHLGASQFVWYLVQPIYTHKSLTTQIFGAFTSKIHNHKKVPDRALAENPLHFQTACDMIFQARKCCHFRLWDLLHTVTLLNQAVHTYPK